MTTKGKIIAGVVAAALIGLYLLSPSFQKLVRRGYDEAQNIRYSAGQAQSQGTPQDGQRDQTALLCRNRMTSIEGAKQALLQDRGYVTSGARVTITDIQRRLNVATSELVCPESGEAYILGGIADKVRCRVGGHGTPTYSGDDHMIQ